MRSFATAIVAAIAAAIAAAVLVVPSSMSAEAAGTRYIESPDITLFHDCRYHEFSYDLNLPEQATRWEADVDVVAPDGAVVWDLYLNYTGDDPAGREQFFLCDTDNVRQGMYDLNADVTWSNDGDDETSFEIDSQFHVAFPQSRVTLSAGHEGKKLVFEALVKTERPHDYVRYSDAEVQLQQKVGGSWQKVARDLSYDHGVATFRRPNRPGVETFRAKTDFRRDQSIDNSMSNVVGIS